MTTTDLSTPDPSTVSERPDTDSDQFYADGRRVPRNRCMAHKKSGAQCKRPAIPGGRVCRHHGGSAPQVIAKARVRLQMQTERMADELIGMALNTDLDFKRPDVRLAAIKEVLDRGGVGVHEQVDVNVDPKPFENLLNKIAGIANVSREESRRLREGVLDAEVVEDPEASDEEYAGNGSGSPGDDGRANGISRPWADGV